jgi:hypothetical protein
MQDEMQGLAMVNEECGTGTAEVAGNRHNSAGMSRWKKHDGMSRYSHINHQHS